MAARQTRGRQRIPMRLIQNQDDLYASFSKRRLGLFKKASELSTLCGADVGIVVFSPTDNPFSFFSPNMESVIDRYMNPDQPLKRSARAVDAHTRARIEELNKRLDEVVEEKHNLKEVDDRFDEVDKTRQKAWWEETAVDKDQVREWIAWFKNFKAQVENQVEQLQNISPTSMIQNYVPSYYAAAADQLGSSTQYFGDEANITPFSPPPPLNLSGGGGGGGGDGGNARSSPYSYRPLPSRTCVGSSSSQVFSPQYRYYVNPAQYVFPAPTTTYLDQSGVDGSGQQFGPPVAALNPPATFCFPPHYRHVPSAAQNLSAAAETTEATTSNHQGGE